MITFDETGRPFIILRDQQAQHRVRGLKAHKQHIMAAKVRVVARCFDLHPYSRQTTEVPQCSLVRMPLDLTRTLFCSFLIVLDHRRHHEVQPWPQGYGQDASVPRRGCHCHQ